MVKIKDKLINWLSRDIVNRIIKLEESNKVNENRINDVYKLYEMARTSCMQSKEETEECRKLMTQILDIGVDVGFHSDDHSWAVICIEGHPEYVKFLPLNGKDTMEILRFLNRFKYSRQVIDSPIAFKSILKNRIL